MPKITKIESFEILDSRGNPTLEVEITLDNKTKWSAKVPSGASTWVHEALELRDWDKDRYNWNWVLKAKANIDTFISEEINWKVFWTFRELDAVLLKLDWTKNKSKLWANAILWVSLAFAKACANYENIELYQYIRNIIWENSPLLTSSKGRGITQQDYILPIPMMNIINGWEHADNSLDFQEFMIVPIWFKTLAEKVRVWTEIFHSLKSILKEKGLATSVGDEGGFAPNISSNKKAIKIVIKAIENAWYSTDDVKISLDVAASEFYVKGKYKLVWEWVEYSSSELITYYEDLVEKYPIFSIEDWLDEDDFEWWALLQEKLWDKVKLVWDDLFVTNIERLQIWIEKKLANSILIKLNQIWTLSETLDAILLAKENNMISIISHRSWETADTFIADLAVATNAWYIKTWSLSRSERVEKYNRLMRIEREVILFDY